MNNLATVDEGRFRLPRHAHLVVYEREPGDELLTIYDCGAAQKPPSAQFIGHLVRVGGDHALERTPTGYVVRMREPSVLVCQSGDRWVVRAD